jgi:hypothetical protein
VELLGAAKKIGNQKFRLHFLLTEWEQVVDAWQLETWESYRNVVRLGRKTRLPEQQRATLWSIFERVRADLASRRMITLSEMFNKLAGTIASSKTPPFDFAVVDEAQDISVAHLQFLAALGAHRPDALFFAGDLGQRNLPTAIFVAGIGRRFARTLPEPSRQLPDFAPDSRAG